MITSVSKIIIASSIVLVSLTGCNTKFDKVVWANADPNQPDDRKLMINDLTKNHKLVGLKYSELIDLLGNSDCNPCDDGSVSYMIEKHWSGIDPDFGQYFILHYDKDSIIKTFAIEKWGEKRGLF